MKVDVVVVVVVLFSPTLVLPSFSFQPNSTSLKFITMSLSLLETKSPASVVSS